MRLKNLFLILVTLLVLASCGSSKKSMHPSERAITSSTDNPVMLRVSENAKEFVGTKYKYGGTTKKGMDCSGLIYTAFTAEDIPFPRTSRDMSHLGYRLNLKEVNVGDLLFFETDKKKRVINHVGLVVDRDPNQIYFIHSTTSRGVIISSLEENYWRENFVMARRVE
ncbi:C40 family peptidase [Salinimicrobium marinum]|nr:C40 family peptidase [Salinimicrobium marinum]